MGRTKLLSLLFVIFAGVFGAVLSVGIVFSNKTTPVNPVEETPIVTNVGDNSNENDTENPSSGENTDNQNTNDNSGDNGQTGNNSNQNTNIVARQYYEDTEITSIVIDDSVTEIGDEAFYGCTNLTTITIGKNVEVIGESVFAGCDNLSEIIFAEENNLTEQIELPQTEGKSWYTQNQAVYGLEVMHTSSEKLSYYRLTSAIDPTPLLQFDEEGQYYYLEYGKAAIVSNNGFPDTSGEAEETNLRWKLIAVPEDDTVSASTMVKYDISNGKPLTYKGYYILQTFATRSADFNVETIDGVNINNYGISDVRNYLNGYQSVVHSYSGMIRALTSYDTRSYITNSFSADYGIGLGENDDVISEMITARSLSDLDEGDTYNADANQAYYGSGEDKFWLLSYNEVLDYILGDVGPTDLAAFALTDWYEGDPDHSDYSGWDEAFWTRSPSAVNNNTNTYFIFGDITGKWNPEILKDLDLTIYGIGQQGVYSSNSCRIRPAFQIG